MEWLNIAMVVVPTFVIATGAAVGYLFVGMAMVGFKDLNDWKCRIAIAFWPILAMFGILIALGRLFREVLIWGAGEE